MGTPVVVGDRVLVATATTGTGSYQLGSAITGYLGPSAVVSGSRVSYVVVDSLTAPTQFEVGEGVYTSGSPSSITRATVIRNSAGGTSAINWGVGTKYLALAPSAQRMALFETDGQLPLAANPTADNQAARKAYVDLRVAKAGDTMTGALALLDGSAGSPALRFSGDLNTGLYRIGGDIIGVTAGGAERLRVSSSAVTVDVPVVLSAGDPLADNQSARKAYVDTKAPKPTASSGVGQWTHVDPGNSNAAVLPAGGTWAWFVTIYNQSTSPAGTLANSGAGVSAGGATIGAAITDREYRGFAWRIA
jgi:hypothetical protein